MGRNIRTRDGNPFNFVDGALVEGFGVIIVLTDLSQLRAYEGESERVALITPQRGLLFSRRAGQGTDNGLNVIVDSIGRVWVAMSDALAGTSAERPVGDLTVGTVYFDTTLGYPIWRNATNTGWVNALGVAVS